MPRARPTGPGPRFCRTLVAGALLLAPLVVAAFPAGCGEAEAEGEKPGEEGKKRSERVREKMKEIERKMAKLPQGTPEQKIAFEQIRSDFKFAKINFESKARARFNNVTVDVYHDTMARLEAIEKKIKRYPR